MSAEINMDKKYIQMTQTPLEPLICRLAFPAIISNLVTTFYNMADTFFIGKLSTSASGAVGIAFSVMAIIQAIGFFFGQGSGNGISRVLGNHDEKTAERLAANGYFSSLICGGIFTVFGLIFLEPLCRFLGSTETILPYAKDYIRYILIGAPYMATSLVLNNQLRFVGNSFYGMIGLASGAVINIVLDPILIFKCNMGISGAALATIISQFISFVILNWGIRHSGSVPIRWKNFSLNLDIYHTIMNGGLPSLCRQGISSISMICLNTAAKPYGDAAIAAMAIVSRIAFFTNSVLLGFGQGFQPVCGFNYGAKFYDRVKKAYWFCVKVGTVFLLTLAVIEIAFAPQLIVLFRKGDPEVARIGTLALRLQCMTYGCNALNMITSMTMQTSAKMFRASFLGLARQGLFLIPIVLILPPWIGVLGIQIAQPIADIITFIFSAILMRGLLKEFDRLSA